MTAPVLTAYVCAVWSYSQVGRWFARSTTTAAPEPPLAAIAAATATGDNVRRHRVIVVGFSAVFRRVAAIFVTYP